MAVAGLFSQETLTKTLLSQNKAVISRGLHVNKKALTAAFILALAFSAVAGVLLIKSATANPVYLLNFPADPVTSPPKIIFQSPINYKTYDSNPVWLVFTILEPESWRPPNNRTHMWYNTSNYFSLVKITSLSYTLDGNISKDIAIPDSRIFIERYASKQPLTFSANETLPVGAHNLVVNLEFDSYYRPAYIGSYPPPSKMHIKSTSDMIIFAVKENGSPDPILTVFPLNPRPSLNILSLTNNTIYYSNNVSLAFALDLSEWYNYNAEINPQRSFSLDAIEYYLDGVLVGEITGHLSRDPYNLSVTLNELTEGSHSLEVIATTSGEYWNQTTGSNGQYYDRVNGTTQGSSGVVYFTIAKPSTFPTSLVASASGVSITGVAVCLLYYHKKRNH